MSDGMDRVEALNRMVQREADRAERMRARLVDVNKVVGRPNDSPLVAPQNVAAVLRSLVDTRDLIDRQRRAAERMNVVLVVAIIAGLVAALWRAT